MRCADANRCAVDIRHSGSCFGDCDWSCGGIFGPLVLCASSVPRRDGVLKFCFCGLCIWDTIWT